MSLLLISASRTFQSSFSRQRLFLPACRLLSTSTNTNIPPADSQQFKGDYPSSRPRQSRKYEGLMPEYINNTELLERQAMEARPLPPPITKHITFDSPPRENFPFKLTLYQYITWLVGFFFLRKFLYVFLAHFVVKFVHI